MFKKSFNKFAAKAQAKMRKQIAKLAPNFVKD